MGVAGGVGPALPVGRLVRTLLVGVSASDVTTLAVTSTAMLAAAVLPAWRAARIDPATALRQQ
jgi:ABC-type lipoprotein release transport system permease subunit